MMCPHSNRLVRANSLAMFSMVGLLLLSSFAGCLGGDDEKKPSKVHVIWGAESTAGTVVHNMAPNSQNQTQEIIEAEFTFDLNETYSEEGEIKTFWVDPGNGDAVVEVNAADMSTVTISYDEHGIFRARVGANDSEGNSGEVDVLLRVEYELHYDNSQSTSDPYPVWFDITPGSDEASPNKAELISNVTNPNSGVPIVNPGGPSTVTWTVRDPTDAENDAHTAEITEGGQDSYAWNEINPDAGGWRMDIDVDGDSVTTETVVYILYDSMESPIPEPPTPDDE